MRIKEEVLAQNRLKEKSRHPKMVPCEQRLHFRGMSLGAKSSKSGRINLKNGFFLVLDRFRALRESCVSE